MPLAGPRLYFPHRRHPFVVLRLLFLGVTQAVIETFTWSADQNSSCGQCVQVKPMASDYICTLWSLRFFILLAPIPTDGSDTHRGHMLTLNTKEFGNRIFCGMKAAKAMPSTALREHEKGCPFSCGIFTWFSKGCAITWKRQMSKRLR